MQGPDFLFNDADSTVFECLASNLVAGETAQHSWQKAESVNGIGAFLFSLNSSFFLNENR